MARKEAIKYNTFVDEEGDSSPSVKVKKSITCIGSFSLVVGGIFGTGTFVTPSLIVKLTDDRGIAMIVWLVSGIISLMAALCYCELGCTYRRAGGAYLYILEAYGKVPAFLCNWITTLMINPVIIAIILMTCGIYAVEGFYGKCEDVSSLRMAKILGVVMASFITVLNCWGTSTSVKVQTLFAVLQISSIAFVIILGIWQIITGNRNNYTTVFDKTADFRGKDIGMVIFAMYNALWTYGGWEHVFKAAEEFQNLERDLFIGIITGVPFTAACFLGINAVIMAVLSKQQIISTPAVLTTFVREILGEKTAYFMPILVAIVSFGAVNACMFSAPWTMVAAAREGHLPQIFDTVHKERRTPVPAILFIFIVTTFMLIPDASTLITLTNYFTVAEWLIRGLVISGVVILRKTQPHLPRPFRISLVVPVFTSIVVVAMIILPFVNTPGECFIAAASILTGIPAYYLSVYKKNDHPIWLIKFMRNMNYQLMRLFNTVPTES